MRWLVAIALLAGCPAPTRYAVERPGLSCDRATRVAHRTLVELGYTITQLDPAGIGRTGAITGIKTLPDGSTTTGRVAIRCDGRGAVLQPIEDRLVPSYEFSRIFGYSFTTLVQRPDVEEPRSARGLEVLVKALTAAESVLDLGGVPTTAGALPVRVTVRNNTDRAVAVDPARLDLVPAAGDPASPLAGRALDAALASGPAAARVRAELLRPSRIAPHTTASGYLVYPAGSYAEARVTIEDVETEESEGFVTPVE